MLIELCGPSGSGKTYLLNCFKDSVDGVVFPDTKIEKIPNPFFAANDENQNYNNVQNPEEKNSDLEEFLNFCFEVIGRSTMTAEQKLTAARITEKSVKDYKVIKAKSDYGYMIMHDELLLHRAFSFLQYSSDFINDVTKFYSLVPVPEAACFCTAPVTTILQRLKKREREVNCYRGKKEEEIIDLLDKSIEICRIGEKILKSRGTKTLSLDLSQTEEVSCKQLKEFVETMIEERKNDLYTQLIEASGSFNKKGERHILKNQGVAYCSFQTPNFTITAENAERDSDRRFGRFGITEEVLKGQTVLDLGSNCGAMLFQASRYGIEKGVGIEYDCEKVALANQIAALSNLQNVVFFQGNIDKLNADGAGYFDIVFAFAIEAHVNDRDHLFTFLGQITRKELYFEGNSKCDVNLVESKLIDAGFKEVEYLGFCDDDIRKQNNNRPMFKAIKKAANAETRSLIKQLKQANQELQKLATQIALKDRDLQKLTTQVALKDRDLQKLTAQIALKDRDLQKLTTQVALKDRDLQKLKTQLTLKDRKLRREMNSWNYKIGSAVTFLPKKIHYLFKKD